jgi:hypothetical protein
LVTLHLVLKSPAASTFFSIKATYSLIRHERPGPSWHEGTTYTASLTRIRMYVWFVDPDVGDGVGREEVDVLLLYERVEVAFM